MPTASTNDELEKVKGMVTMLNPQWEKITDAFKKLWGETEAD